MRTDDSKVELINQRNQQFLLALRIAMSAHCLIERGLLNPERAFPDGM